MKTLPKNLALAVLCGFGLLSPAYAAKPRLALVIGNSNYNIANGQLPNARGDAEQVAEQLRGLDFDVIIGTDIRTRKELKTLVENFIGQAGGREIALLYYSGHGVQYDGHNYLIPTQETISQAYQVEDNALGVDYLLKGMKEMHPQLGVVILDACRTNPFPKSDKGPSRGLTRITAPSDIVVAYATEPGNAADDGNGTHSPYAQALLAHFQNPTSTALPMTEFFNRVGVTVEQLSGGGQSPRLELPPLHNTFCFRHCNDVGGSPRIAQPVETAPVQTLTQQVEARPVQTLTTQHPFEPPMVAITGDCSFQMGSPTTESDRDSDERQHEVCVDDFEIGQYEVTKGQFAAFVAATHYQTEAEKKGDSHNWRNPGYSQTDQHPVVYVSWNDANAYINWLNQQTQKNYHLPSEAQWEYAARAGTKTIYPWGDSASHEYANYGKDVCCDGLVSGKDQWEFTAPVGSFAPYNGVYDMLGNVWEWTCSVYDSGYGGGEMQCPSSNDANSLRVLRGGSWDNVPDWLRPATRHWDSPFNRDFNLGFRLSRM